jgi:hypothetical protein
MLDIFNSDPFGVVALTDAINKTKYVPGRLSQLGIFRESSVAVTTVTVEEKNGILTLVEPTPRGGPGQTADKGKRNLRAIPIPHFQIDDAIMAEEVQNIRPFGEESGLETVMAKVDERMQIHSQSMAATQEFARIGAFKGIVTYADGSELDLFDLFGVSQDSEVDFDLDNANPASGALRKKCAQVVRQVANTLDGTPYTHLLAECDDAFFDDLIANKEVVDSYKGTPMAQVLRDGYVLPDGSKIFGAFEFGGIVWENYRGKVGNASFIDANKCHIAPMGVPGLFRTVYGPADYVDTVNTLGRRLYMRQRLMRNDKGVEIDVQMNNLEYCTRPAALIKGKRT